MKTCGTCKQLFTSFSWKRTGVLRQSRCVTCQRAYRREYCRNNRDKYIALNGARNKRIARELQAFAHDIKSRTPCSDCGKIFHYCQMDFDHMADKKFSIMSDICQGAIATMKSLVAEIDKCQVVCSNCHRMRTFMRRIGKVY